MAWGSGSYTATGVISGTPYESPVALTSITISPTSVCNKDICPCDGKLYSLTGAMSVDASLLGIVTGTMDLAGPFDPDTETFDFCGDATGFNDPAAELARFSTLTMVLDDSAPLPPPVEEPDPDDICPAVWETRAALVDENRFFWQRVYRTRECPGFWRYYFRSRW